MPEGKIVSITENIIKKMGFENFQVSVQDAHRKVSIVVDDEVVTEKTAEILPALEYLFNLILKKETLPAYVVDLNYYRKERERLIIELTRAASRKALLSQKDIELPAMNGYERRLVHLEVAAHPSLKTESTGQGKDRKVIIRLIKED